MLRQLLSLVPITFACAHAVALDLTWGFFDRTSLCCGPAGSGFGSYEAAVRAARAAGALWQNGEPSADPLWLYPRILPREAFKDPTGAYVASSVEEVCRWKFARVGGAFTGPIEPWGLPDFNNHWKCGGLNSAGGFVHEFAYPACVSAGYSYSNFGFYDAVVGRAAPADACYSNNATQIIASIDPKKTNGCSTDVGNPCNAALGIKTHHERVYASGGLMHPLSFEWFYSTNMYTTPVKTAGWSHTYDQLVVASSNNRVFAYRENGVIVGFALVAGAYVPDTDISDRLLRLVDGNGNTTGWTYHVADSEDTENYDATGRLLSIRNRRGATLTMTYSDADTPPATAPRPGLLIRVSDPLGRQLALSYDSESRLAALDDPGGNVHEFSFDAAGNLVAIHWPDGTSRRMLYEEANFPSALTGIVDEAGQRFATYHYDTAGRVDSESHAGGVYSHSFAYRADGSTIVTDPLGIGRQFNFQVVLGAVRKAAMSQPCATCRDKSKAVGYDGNGNVASRADFNDRKTCYAYDSARNLETARIEGLLSSESCGAALGSPPNRPDVRLTRTTWNPDFRLPATVVEPAPGGWKTTAFTYDSAGNLIRKDVTGPTNDGTGGAATRTWSWTYASLGRIAAATDPNNNVTAYSYYADDDADVGKRGNLAAVTNALGHVTQVTAYDMHGRPLRFIDASGMPTVLTYDTRGRLDSRNVGGETTVYGYDGIGQLVGVTSPDGSALAYTYDAAHRLTGIADELGNRVDYTLDAMGNRIREDVRDHAGTLARTRSRTFDALNRLAADIGAQAQATAYAYDGNGNALAVTNPLTHRTSNVYDALNRLVQVTDPAGGAVRYGYDAAGNLMQVADPRALATVYTYDGLGNPVKQVSPDTGTTVQRFDRAGNLTAKVDARGVTASYGYDALNRVTQIAYSRSGSPAEIHGFEYDGGIGGPSSAKGRLTKLVDPAATTRWTYTLQGRVATKSQQVGALALAVAYSYNAAGQRTTVTTPSGQVLGYSYLDGRVAGITVNGTPLITSAVAAPFGPIAAWQWGNGLHTFREYDTDGRIADWEFRNGTSVLRNNLTWDAAGRIATIADPTNAALQGSYQYDVLDRLTVAQKGNPVSTTQQYGYDAVGNRVNITTDGRIDNLTYGATSNQLVALSGVLNPDPLNGDSNRSFVYNLANRLVQVQSGTRSLGKYQVNALGQRIAKTVAGDTTRFVYDEQGHLLGEYEANGKLIQETVWLEDLPVATLRPRPGSTGSPVTVDLYYVHADHLGSPRAITNPGDNSIMWRWDNVDPFGANAADENPGGQGAFEYGLRLPGQYFDAETGTHYNYFRDYDPSIGRYIESDPIGLKGGVNTYAYVKASPLVRSDRYGLWGFAPPGEPPGSGCGDADTDPFVPDNPLGFAFLGACRQHDKCYDTCWASKVLCDQEFLSNLRKACTQRWPVVAQCVVLAYEYYYAVVKNGQTAYDNAQRKCNQCFIGVEPKNPDPTPMPSTF
jgi:RHS repeat-associated protein